MSIIDRILGGSSEKQIMDRGKKIIEHAVAANKVLVKIIKGSKDLDEIKRLERLPDNEVFEISNSITSGAVAPNLIDDMIRFIDMEDSIVDTIFNLSRAIVRYKGKNRKVNKYITENLLSLTDLIDSGLVLLREMHNADTVAEAQKIRQRIEVVEQNGDEIKDAMLDYAFESKDLDFRSFYYVQSAAYLADDILDGCEDTSDMILSIMRGILT